MPEKEGYEDGYAMLEPLTDVYLDSSKHKPLDATIVKEGRDEYKEIQI